MIELTETEKAYIAGIVDGEGAIYIVNPKNSFNLIFEVNNTNEALMEWLSFKLRKKLYKCSQREFLDGYKITKTIQRISLCGSEVRELLKEILPWLIVKKPQAEVALDYPIHEKKIGMEKYMSDEDRLKQAICYIRMKKLNV